MIKEPGLLLEHEIKGIALKNNLTFVVHLFDGTSLYYYPQNIYYDLISDYYEKRYPDKITSKQLKCINYIQRNCQIKFIGSTKTEASRFIKKNLQQSQINYIASFIYR